MVKFRFPNLSFSRVALLAATIAITALSFGCGSSGTTRFIHPNADLAAVKKVAVLPFENLSEDRTAGDKVQKIFTVELLSLQVFDVAEPGLTNKVVRGAGVQSIDAIGPAEIKQIGSSLGADALFLGSVVEYEESRSGANSVPQVTIQLRLVETQTGATIWTASQTKSGVPTSVRLFGIGGESQIEAARELVRHELGTLLK